MVSKLCVFIPRYALIFPNKPSSSAQTIWPGISMTTHGIRNTVISCCLKYRLFSSSINTRFK